MDQGDETYEVVGQVVDNSGNYSMYDVEEGCLIYVFDSTMNTTFRYEVTEVILRKSGKITLVAAWDVWDTEIPAEEPSINGEAIIGAKNPRTNMIYMTSSSMNEISETLQVAVENFEQDLIANLIDLKEDKVEPPESGKAGVLAIDSDGQKTWIEVYTKDETDSMLNINSLKEFE